MDEWLPRFSLAQLIGLSESEEAEPGPTNPDGFFKFRRLQLQDEKGYIPPDGLEKARRHVQLMLAAREERRKTREKAGLPASDLYSSGIGPNAWEWLGPGNIGGRIRAIVIHPTEPNKMWIGSVSGGIWHTTNSGSGWQPVNDFMANLAVTTMVIDPTNPSIMYAGTGEGFGNIDAIQGAGIFKSTDGGVTWNQLSSTANAAFFFVNRLSISPGGGTLLAATSQAQDVNGNLIATGGIQRSTDGGTTWTQPTTNQAMDVDFRPGDGSRAIVGQLGSASFSTDFGQTWNAATFNPPINPGAGNNGRVELAYAPSLGGSLVYASVNQNNGDVYRSTDGGQNYTRVNTGTNFFVAGSPNQGWYDNVIWVNPINSAFVIVGGIHLWRSTDSGNTFTQISDGTVTSAHADHHIIVAHPGFNNNDNQTVFFGNDGGIHRLQDINAEVPAGMTTLNFLDLNNNLGITQFYGGAGNNASQIIIGGTQDNGTLRFSGNTEGWTLMQGSDGGYCAADQTDSNYFYGETQNLGVVRSTDGGLTSTSINAGITDATCTPPPGGTCNPPTNFIAPLVIDPLDPNTLLAGGISLWRHTNVKGAFPPNPGDPTWTAIKPPTASNSPISAITVSPGSSSFILVGNNNGDIFRTTNGTAGSPTWTQIDTAAVPNRVVTRLVIDNTRTPNWIYATFGGFAVDNIYRSTDLGTTWTDVTGAGATGLPSVPVRALTYHPDRTDLLYVGTEVGIFTSEDGGATWDVNQDGPANVSVDELFFMAGPAFFSKALIAVTHGRGVYRVGDVLPPPIVTTTDDGGGDNENPVPGSLREAILRTHNTNNTGDVLTIKFAIPGGPGVKTINLGAKLPLILQPVFIDGWSQGGPDYTGPPLIELNGSQIVREFETDRASGLHVHTTAGGSYIRGLIINRCFDGGIDLNAGNNLVEGCYIGTSADGNADLGNGAEGVWLPSSNNRLIGNVISGNDLGVLIGFTSGNVLKGNYIGTNAAGTARLPNTNDGIRIFNSSGNTIGGTGVSEGNLISGNGTGLGADAIKIESSTSSGNIVQNNIIGLNAAGTAILANSGSGVHIINAPGNIIGGSGAATRNILSGASVGFSIGGYGIHIEGSSASGTQIRGNYIGTSADGNADLGNNGGGIFINNAPNTIIGGLVLDQINERNVISGNNNAQIYITGSLATGTQIKGNYVGLNATGDARVETSGIIGIRIESGNNQIGGTGLSDGNVISGNSIGISLNQAGASSNIVQGNRIGTDKTGTVDLGNSGDGIFILRGANNLIGGTTPEARNLISGNNASGITIAGDSANPAQGNLIQGNFIGTNAAGTASLGSNASGTGILLNSVIDVTIGGTAPGAGNLISGNGNSFGSNGVHLAVGHPNSGLVVQGNLIGTNAAGTAVIGNAGSGILVSGFGSGVTIGGATAAARNLIVGNDQYGIQLNGAGGNVVKGNLIGTDVTGTANWHNNISGISVGSPNNVIGGTSPGEANLIAFNGTNSNHVGVQILDGGAIGNRVRGNSIYSNTGIGIDLGGLGLTANDNCDTDTGANGLQNFPILTSAGNDAGTTLIAGSLNSTASASFTLDFYANPSCDASGNGEGKTYIGSFPVNTDATCATSFAVTLPIAVAVGQTITTTAIDAAGNTSEFSACRPVTAGLTLAAGTYSTIIINSGTTVTLTGDVTVTGNLTLNGDLNTAGFTLTMPAAATSSGTGDVIGNLRRTGITLGTPLSFGNPFNTIQFDSGTPPTEVTVTLTKSAPAGFPNAVQRTYTITPTGGSNYSATLQLHYLDGELNGNAEAAIELWRSDGSVWAGQGATLRDAIDNWVRLSGVTQFSPWTIAGPGGPTAIDLVSFTATGYDNGTLLEWQTGLEVDNLGFNVYREDAGNRQLINQQLVAGSALRAGSRLLTGESYGLFDGQVKGLKSTAVYWLEDVDLKGQSTWHGPFYTTYVGGNPPPVANVTLLNKLGAIPVSISATRMVERFAPSAVSGKPLSDDINPLASQSALKIYIKREGLYRITQNELAATGFDVKVDPRMLQLFVDGQELPIAVSTNKDGLLQSIDFYGLGIDTPSTDARAYWLIAGNHPGKRIPTVEDEGVSSSQASFTQTVERRDRTLYFAALKNGERENFFGAIVTSQLLDQPLTLQHLAPSTEPALLEVTLQGITQTPHRVLVLINDVVAGFINFNGQAQSSTRFILPHAHLREGLNTVRLASQNGTSDVSAVDCLRLSYQHTYNADNDVLRFNVSGKEQITVDSFTNQAIRVFDITDAGNPAQLMTHISESKTGFAVTVATSETGTRQLLAITDEQLQQPASLSLNSPSHWRDKRNAANLVMLTAKGFFTSLEPLKRLRESQGFKVAMVDVEDLYDEFNFGHKSPQAIRDFLQYAQSNWAGKLRFVMLVGDATYDTKNYLGLGDWDLVPTKLVDTNYMETASDDWFADFDNDGISELSIGRLPMRTLAEAGALVKKLTAYETSVTPFAALLVSDANDGFDFEQASRNLKPVLPAAMRIEELQRGRLDPTTAKAQLLAALTTGQRLINYTGHGSLNMWRGNLLTATEAVNLNQANLPMFVLMNCLNGYLHDATMDALGEALIKAEPGGAIAVWASSGLTLPESQNRLNQAFYKQLFSNPTKRLGEAAMAAKQAVTDTDVRRTWILLGDPTLRLR
ncbi:MAG: C25 family cysteine peptidase [Acidobacteriota bacterium]